jgi:small-conductance mechanosensitive channel
MILQEQSGFAAQIEDANNSLYFIEERWSREAADLRRRADEAQRRADDEHSRLQSDLDDVETKLKKVQRGW